MSLTQHLPSRERLRLSMIFQYSRAVLGLRWPGAYSSMKHRARPATVALPLWRDVFPARSRPVFARVTITAANSSDASPPRTTPSSGTRKTRRTTPSTSMRWTASPTLRRRWWGRRRRPKARCPRMYGGTLSCPPTARKRPATPPRSRWGCWSALSRSTLARRRAAGFLRRLRHFRRSRRRARPPLPPRRQQPRGRADYGAAVGEIRAEVERGRDKMGHPWATAVR